MARELGIRPKARPLRNRNLVPLRLQSALWVEDGECEISTILTWLIYAAIEIFANLGPRYKATKDTSNLPSAVGAVKVYFTASDSVVQKM